MFGNLNLGNIMSTTVTVLRDGYSSMEGEKNMRACGTSTLIKSDDFVVLVDTLGPWEKQILIDNLKENNLTPDQVNFVVCTHGHPDHVGNLNLFTDAYHFVGHNFYKKDFYDIHELDDPIEICANVEVFSTPGHTLEDISVLVKNVPQLGTVVVAGDLFEKEADLSNDSIWKDAGSMDEKKQMENRASVLAMADYIVPGHGSMFKVPSYYK